MTAAEEERLRVGADVFCGNNVDSVRLRNAHVLRMTLILKCRGMALGIVQRSEVPNDAWRNLESYYRAKGTKEILRLSHKVDEKSWNEERTLSKSSWKMTC